jgi:PAS domain S-box-containing protein
MKNSRFTKGKKVRPTPAGQRRSRGNPQHEKEITQLKDSVTQYRSLLDGVPGTVARLDLAGRYLFVNKYFLSLTGLPLERIIGHGPEVIQPFIAPDSFSVMVKAVGATMREQKTTEVEICGTDCKGIRHWLAQVSKPWYDRHRRFAGAEILSHDITQRKCAEEQMTTYHTKLQLLVDERTAKLRKTEKELFQRNKLLSEKNIALRQVMGQLEEEKKSIAETVRNNMEQLIMPQIDKIRAACSADGRRYLQLLEYNLKEITAGFGKRGFAKLNTLTQKEIEICDMIKRGMSCKEIASLQNTSPRTVETHRNRIRKKLGITDTSVNLVTYLKNL